MESENISTVQNQSETQDATTPQTTERKVLPRLFYGKDEPINIEVAGYYNRDTGEFEFAMPSSELTGNEDLFLVVRHVFTFSRVPYNRLNIYRNQSMTYGERSNTTINVIRLREFFWTFHLQDWNIQDNDGNRVELQHTPDGALTDESMEVLNQLPASLLDTAISMFERRINIA